MTLSGSIVVGSPVVLKDAAGIEEFGHFEGQLGWANSIVKVPEDKSYVFFMPTDSKSTTVIALDRLELDEEREGLELNQDTIYKGE